jgi:DNA-binding transcriptional MerR regulator
MPSRFVPSTPSDEIVAPERLPIGVVAQLTGLSRNTLLAWERRYGFPLPVRDRKGGRYYTHEQIQRLLRVKRLVDDGFKPGKVFGDRD